MKTTTYTTSLNIYSAELQKYPSLQSQENAELIKSYRSCSGKDKEKAYHQLITGNLKLVVNEAWKLHPSSLPIEDMIAEGNLGLIMAIQKYNPQVHISFSTYATYVIRGYILVAISETSFNVKIPRHIFAEVKAFNESRMKYIEMFEREPSVDDLVEYMHYNKKKIQKVQNCQSLLKTGSLDEIQSEPTSSQPMSMISSSTPQLNPEEIYLNKIAVSDIYNAINMLDPDERYILSHINDIKELRAHFLESTYRVKNRRIKALQHFFDLLSDESEIINEYKKYFSKKYKHDFAAQNSDEIDIDRKRFFINILSDKMIDEIAYKILYKAQEMKRKEVNV